MYKLYKKEIPMRASYEQSMNYQRRRQSRYGKEQTPSLGKRLVEQMVTQLTICVIITGLVLGGKVIGFEPFNKGMEKIKIAITYSPSLDEIAREAKAITTTLIEKASEKDDYSQDETLPEFIIDDEIF